MAALKAVNLKDTPRGPIKFDHLGNVVGDFYVRHLRKEVGRALRPQALEQDGQDLRERQPVLGLGRRRSSSRIRSIRAIIRPLKKC